MKLVRFRPGLKEHVESAELDQTLELCYQELLQKNILSPATDRFTLFHDKVQEASYSLLTKEEKSFLHYEYAVICIAGIDSTADKGNNSAVFEAAYHVCRGHQKELPKAIRKFLVGAATAARQVFAYDKAREYLQTLMEAIDGQPETDLEETFNALELLADTLVMSDQIAAALELYDKLLTFDCDPIRRALIYAKKVEFCLNLFDYQNARRACEAGLDVLGERIFTTEIRSYLYIFASLPFLVIYAVYFKIFGRQTKEIKTEFEEIRFQLLLKSEISQYFTQPIVAIANIIPLTFELLSYKDNKHRASLFGYWGTALSAFGVENFANTCYRHAYNYFDKTANPVDKSFVLFCWGFTSDVPRGNLQAGQKKIEEALSNLAPLGESFWRSMCTLSLLLLDYYGAENGQAGLRSHEFIELWKKIRFAATPLSCIFRHSLESGNREQAEQILAHVEAADLNLQTLGYDTLDSVLGCLGIAEYSDYIGKPEQAEKFAKRTFTLNLKRSHRVTFALFPPILYARILIKQNRKLQALGILGIAWINQLLRVRVFHPQTCYESGRWFFALGWPRVGRMIIERGIRYASARNWLTPAAEGRLLLGELMHEFDPDLAHVYVHMARQHFQVRNWKFHENLCEQVLNNRKSTRNEETEGSLVTEQASRSATRRSTALRQQVETRALMDILLKLSATNDTTALYQGLLESLCQATGAELAVLYFRENERWFPHAAHNIRIEAADLFKVKVDQHFIQKTLQASPTDPIIRKSEGQQWGRPSAAGSVMLLPLKSEGTIAGYCYLANTQLYDLFSQRSIDIAQPIATQGAIALQNIRLNKQLAVERDQISRLHQTLELRVIEQTRDIQSIMEHIELGICTVSGSDISIHKDYSRHLEYVFAESNLRDKPLMPLLAHCTTMTADEIDQASQALLACFNEQEFAFEANSHLLPRSLNGLNQNHDRFAFELDWIPICNDYHTVERVLVSIKDVTALKGMEKAAAQKDEEMGIISEILNRSEHDWSNFTRNCNSLASKNRILMEDLQTCSDPMSTLKSMFMNIHTVKGIARSFGFRQMNDAIHSAEQFFVDVMSKNPLNVNLDAVQLNLSTIEATFQRYHNIAIQKLARKVSGDEAVNVPRNPLMTIYEHLNIQLESGTPFSDCLLDSIKVMRQSLFISLEGLVRQLFSETAPISVELGKPVPDLSLNIVELWVGRSTEDLLRNCFVHLLRNSLDHGIQMPAERQAKGLPAHGTVRVTARLRGRMVDLFVEDDGRGLDLKKLQEIGLKKGLLARQASENAENLANLIFNADLSTAETVTSISGRGVGMAAVKESIDQVGGIINIRLQKNRAVDEGYCAFAFVISLPLVLFQLDDSQKAA